MCATEYPSLEVKREKKKWGKKKGISHLNDGGGDQRRGEKLLNGSVIDSQARATGHGRAQHISLCTMSLYFFTRRLSTKTHTEDCNEHYRQGLPFRFLRLNGPRARHNADRQLHKQTAHTRIHKNARTHTHTCTQSTCKIRLTVHTVLLPLSHNPRSRRALRVCVCFFVQSILTTGCHSDEQTVEYTYTFLIYTPHPDSTLHRCFSSFFPSSPSSNSVSIHPLIITVLILPALSLSHSLSLVLQWQRRLA